MGIHLILLSAVWLAAGFAVALPVKLKDVSAAHEAQLRQALPQIFSATPELQDLDEAIRILMATGNYENVFADRAADGDFSLIGKPLRTIEEIRFTGIKEGHEAELREQLELKVGERFDRKRAVASGEKMKNYYGEHGYFNTVIELNFERTDSGNIRLRFNIDEKPPCLVKSVTWDTPNTDLKKLLTSNFKWLLNKPLTTERTKRLMSHLNDLLIDHRYLATEVTVPDPKYNTDKTEAYMRVEVREPFKYEFYFNGNRAFTTVDIYRALDLTNHERKNVEPSTEGTERLRRAYLERGFPSVQIDTKVNNEKAPYLKRIYYTINEGPHVRIKAIEVQGRVSRPSKYYQDFILNNSSDLVQSGYYNRQALENGFKNLITDLRNQGFLHARTLSSRVEYNDPRNAVTVYLLLEEGPQTQIRALDFTGNKFFSSFELAEVTGLETNSPLHLARFEESLDKLKNFYHNQGFIEMRLLNEGADLIQYNDKGTQARIGFQIYEGPRVRVHAINVEGNAMTQTRVILQEADFNLGEVLNPAKVDDATIRLNRLSLFNRVDIHTLEEGTNVSERTLVISVSERDPGVFRFGGGVTSERQLTLRGFTGASYNNLFGTARAISARAEIRSNVAEVRYPETEFTVGYLEPFLFNTRTRGRINVTRSEYVFNYEAYPDKFTEITTKNRIDFSVERDLTRHNKFTYKVWSLESRTDFERYGRQLPDPNNPNAQFDPNAGKGSPNTMQVALTGPQLDIDYRDNPFLPTRGSFARFTADYSNPNIGSSKGVEFIKLDANYRFYQKLGSPKVVWANSLQAGYLSNLSRQEDSGVPTDYAFVLGGIYTLRGYDLASPNERVPRDGDADWRLGTTNQKLIKTDSNYYLLKSEVRFPVYGSFGGVVFYDGAAVRVSGYDFGRPYQSAAGIGMRYNTPVGPVALDFAVKINPEGARPDLGQDPQSWFRIHFSVGTF